MINNKVRVNASWADPSQVSKQSKSTKVHENGAKESKKDGHHKF